MFQAEPDSGSRKKAEEIANVLVGGYQDHGFCIDLDEAVRIGLRSEQLPAKHECVVWELYKLNKKKEEIERQRKQKQLQDAMKSLPPDIVKRIAPHQEHDRALMASTKSRAHLRADADEMAVRIADALLTQCGEITMTEIRALPLVRDDSHAQRIFTCLLENPNAESGQRKVASTPVLRWERYIRLNDIEKTDKGRSPL